MGGQLPWPEQKQFSHVVFSGVKVYTRIDYKFLIPGHTYGPTDRRFTVIEKHASRVEAVYTPQQEYGHVREAVIDASCRIEVTEMQQSNFRNYSDHLRKQYTERTRLRQ